MSEARLMWQCFLAELPRMKPLCRGPLQARLCLWQRSTCCSLIQLGMWRHMRNVAGQVPA